MATYTSTQAGPWNDPATWGGGGFPQLTNDVFNIGHLVTLNVQFNPVTVAFGQGNINNNGILTFDRNMNTRLPFGHQDLVINSGGWLKVGESGLVIPKQYLAELIWNTTSDNAKGIDIKNGGKLSVYGDPDYYGSVDKSTLISQAVIPAATNAVTITVAGDVTTKWVAGQELLVHSGGNFTGHINDFCRLAITSLAANGANTDVACTVTERPAALTCLVGADVLHITRNVRLYKYGYNANLGQFNTNRPRIANANTAGTANVNMSNLSVAGFYRAFTGWGVFFDGVVRNGYSPIDALYATVNGIICMNADIYTGKSSVINAWGVGSNGGGIMGQDNIINGNLFGNGNYGAVGGGCHIINGHVYSNNRGTSITMSGSVFKGNLGYDGAGIQKNNGYDFAFEVQGRHIITVINSLTRSTPPNIYSRNTLGFNGRVRFEHYLQVTNSHCVMDIYGDSFKVAADGSGDNPSQRSGGGANVLEVTPQSNCGANSFAYFDLLNVRLWAAAGVSKTYRFSIQTDFVTLPSAELKLYGEYLDAGSGGHLATVTSTQGINTRSQRRRLEPVCGSNHQPGPGRLRQPLPPAYGI